jgi:hypothetical protein
VYEFDGRLGGDYGVNVSGVASDLDGDLSGDLGGERGTA